MAQPINNLLRMAQTTGGEPYDESQYMPMQGLDASPVNNFLNARMSQRVSPLMYQYMTRDRDGIEQPQVVGSDMDMMQMYGPEDQVAFDQQGNPIPLADPRHPRNQMQSFQPMPIYPQQRR